jgi:hypothetical protein
MSELQILCLSISFAVLEIDCALGSGIRFKSCRNQGSDLKSRRFRSCSSCGVCLPSGVIRWRGFQTQWVALKPLFFWAQMASSILAGKPDPALWSGDCRFFADEKADTVRYEIAVRYEKADRDKIWHCQRNDHKPRQEPYEIKNKTETQPHSKQRIQRHSNPSNLYMEHLPIATFSSSDKGGYLDQWRTK